MRHLAFALVVLFSGALMADDTQSVCVRGCRPLTKITTVAKVPARMTVRTVEKVREVQPVRKVVRRTGRIVLKAVRFVCP